MAGAGGTDGTGSAGTTAEGGGVRRAAHPDGIVATASSRIRQRRDWRMRPRLIRHRSAASSLGICLALSQAATLVTHSSDTTFAGDPVTHPMNGGRNLPSRSPVRRNLLLAVGLVLLLGV